MPDIFLSYNREDQAVARRFAEGFERAGFSVWWDVTLHSGEAYDKVTEAALRDAKAVVVLWSKKSVESRWVRAEATEADRNGTLVPVMIEACRRPIMFELTHTAELMHWKGDASDPAWRAFVVDVQRFVNKTHVDSPAAAAALSQQSATHPWHRSGKNVAALAAVVLLLAGAAYALLPKTAPVQKAVATIVPAAASTEEHSIVVLPFRDLSDTHDQQSLADGSSEEISSLLTSIPELKVIGQVSANFFRDKQEDLAQMRERLAVDNVLTGSVRMNGNELRIGVQLVSTQDGRQLWNENFSGTKLQIFEFQERIATQVAAALQIRLGVGKLAHSPGMTRSVEAWEEYQKGAISGTYNETTVRDAASHLERALKLDPDFHLAAYRLLYLYEIDKTALVGGLSAGDTQRVQEVRSQLAKDEIGQVFVKVMDANVDFVKGNYLKALPLIRQALADFQARGLVLENVNLERMIAVFSGRHQQALSMLEREHALDPFDTSSTFFLAAMRSGTGDQPRAIRLLQDVQTTMGTQEARFDGQLLEQYMLARDVPHMKQAYQHQQLIATASGDQDINAAMMSRLEDRKAALAWLRERLNTIKMGPLELDVAAFWAAYFEEPQLALDFHAAMLKNGSAALSRLEIFRPNFNAMRKLPGFKQLVKDLGLVDFWRATHDWGDFCQPLPNTESDFECH